MIYCNLRGYVHPDPKMYYMGAEMTVSQLFSKRDSYNDVDTALAHPINEIPHCGNVPIRNTYTLHKGEWIETGDKSISSGYLTSCAAVLFYGNNGRLFAAGHAAFGTIGDQTIPDELEKKINSNSVQFAIYATPKLLPEDPTFASYRSSIMYLANLCGGAKICFLDGFEVGGSVLANAEGGLTFSKSLPKSQ